MTLYGIKNCDTVKRARKWLDAHRIDYAFHDFREDGLEANTVSQWLGEMGWEALINKRSTTWKALDQSARDSMDDANALDAILATPTLIKRPLLDTGRERHTGFKPGQYEQIFKSHAL